MVFLLKLICCAGGTFILAGVVTAFMEWWEKQPVVEARERPFYITKTYEEIKNGYDN